MLVRISRNGVSVPVFLLKYTFPIWFCVCIGLKYDFMKLVSYLRKHYSYLVIAALTGLYLLFLSVNPVGDSFSNAYLSLSGENMFEPHHLLYCLWGNILLRVFSFLSIEPIVLLQGANALLAGGCLLVLRRIIKRINHKEAFISSSILFCGSCFGFLRFATDNECYIAPLFLTLLALYYLQIFLIRNKVSRIAKATLCVVAACLFHQLSILVWLCILGVVLTNRNHKYLIIYIVGSLAIPIVYFFASYLTLGTLSLGDTIGFALRDYISGAAQMPQIKQVILLTGISLVRTFVQVHGYVFELFQIHTLTSVSVAVLAAMAFVCGVVAFAKDKKRDLHLFQERRFVRVLWVLLVLTIGFAAFSNGNAEFMLLIPFLLVLLHAYYYSRYQSLLCLGVGLLVWNLFFALFPLGRLELSPESRIAELTRQYPNAVFVLSDKPTVENICLYRYGKENLPILKHSHLYTKEDYLRDKAEGRIIITDVIGAENSLSRAEITQSSDFRFQGIKERKLLFKFSSFKCKRSLYRL